MVKRNSRPDGYAHGGTENHASNGDVHYQVVHRHLCSFVLQRLNANWLYLIEDSNGVHYRSELRPDAFRIYICGQLCNDNSYHRQRSAFHSRLLQADGHTRNGNSEKQRHHHKLYGYLQNAHVALDQAEYQKRYDALVARFDKAKARHTEVTDLIIERTARRHQIETYLKELRSREPLTEFRETDWLAMVDFITVHSKKDIRVTFKDGTEIKA